LSPVFKPIVPLIPLNDRGYYLRLIDMNSLITIARYEQANAACFLKEVLEDEDIECYIAYSFNLEKNADEVQFQVKDGRT
jgi:hypothetical protein